METEKYSITSPKNFEAFETTGNNKYLNDVRVEEIESGDKIVIAWEGGSIKVVIK